jgi:predicted aspartyl protease
MKNSQILAFTSRYKELSRVLKNEVNVTAVRDKDQPESKKVTAIAIWDTGATATTISKRIVDELGLKPIGMQTLHTPNGSCDRYTYLVDIILPNHVIVPSLIVTGTEVFDADMLIGMDIISLGDLSITNFKKTTFSFQIPSQNEVDYVNPKVERVVDATGRILRRRPCSCGSGKLYKNCCEKTDLAKQKAIGK